jgi:chromosome segregation ATPase
VKFKPAKQLKEKQSQIRDFNLEILNLKEERQSNLEEIERLQNQVATLSADKQKMISNLKDYEDELKKLNLEVQSNNLSELSDNLELANKLLNVEQKILNLKSQLADKDALFENANKEISQKNVENNLLNQQIADLNERNANLQSEVASKSLEISEINKELNNKILEVTKLKEKKLELELELENACRKLEESNAAYVKSNYELKSLKKSLESQLSQVRNTIANKDLEIKRLKDSEKITNEKIGELTKSIDS